jgi:very-short-patch-repair endonuclease
VARAAKAWTDQLIDVGGNNKLLFYRSLKVGTLELTPGTRGLDVTVLLRLREGKGVRLSGLFSDPDDRAAAARKVRGIAAKALENQEERGVATLFLAWGMATWTNPGKSASTPRAPLFLLPITAKRRSASGDDFDLEVDGETEFNPTLVHYLHNQLGTTVDPDQILSAADAVEGVLGNPAAGLDALRAACAAVPGFVVDETVVLGNFSFAKLPMVKDIQLNLDAMIDHDLIAALAGDPEAQASLRAGIGEVDEAFPNRIAPSDEYLILPADSSQNHAINRVLNGESLVIQGPPGTGKSQTIANLIASSIAYGRKVLFVAEKRAAIEAVMDRLTGAGLGDVVLDLHSKASSRSEIMKAFADASEAAGSITAPDLGTLHQSLVTARSALVTHDTVMHKKRSPWDVSLYDLQVEMLGTRPEHRTDVRLSNTDIRRIDRAALTQAITDLHEYLTIRQLDGNPGPGRWAGAPLGTDTTAQAAAWVSDALALWERAGRELSAACGEMQAPLPKTGSGAVALVGACSEAASLLQVLSVEGLMSDDLESVAAGLLTGTGGLARLKGPYRQAKKRTAAILVGGASLDAEALNAVLARAIALRSTWPNAVGSSRIIPPSNLVALHAAVSTFDATLGAGAAAFLSPGAFIDQIDDTVERLSNLQASTDSLHRQPRLRELERSLEQAGVGSIRNHCVSAGTTPNDATQILKYCWLRTIYDLEAPPDLGAFSGNLQDDRVKTFRRDDREHLARTPQRVRRAVAETSIRVRDEHGDQTQILQNQFRRKRGLRPIRELFREAPDVMLALKPCWTMSPLLVAQMLPGDKQYFDLVIFDEASQVTPADAVSAMLRAPQAVVAGDSRQLPPTAFFATDTAGDLVDDEGGDEDPDLSLAKGFESVLDVGASLMRAAYLNWHYRSEDERLIAFSNAHIYDDRLTTFPGVAAGDCLTHVLAPPSADSASDPAGPEVAAVTELVLRHARERPRQSLGVIAMGIKHAERIAEAVRGAVARSDDRTALEPFFNEAADERFFVKNLERVQGDERDAIILTTGYGPGPDGRMRYSFGPLNTEGGERRLNVAISRARSQMTVVSSFSADQMDPAKTKSKGADLLRRYIRYAETSGADLGFGGSKPVELNPFEIEVRDALEGRGVPLLPQYGVSSYRLDFAACHPDKPGQMVLAIECDGATYHSSPTARDRDRLRQEMLERLGWRFHRIWSTDWFRDPATCTDRAVQAWMEAVQRADSETAAKQAAESDGGAPPPTEGSSSEPSASPARVGPKPVIGGGLPITEYSPSQLDSLVRWIKSDTLLRTRDELVEEALRELGYRRRGARIMAAIEAAVERTSR